MSYVFNPFTGTLDKVGPLTIGDTVFGGTPGSILFVDSAGNLGQDNAAFFYNDTLNRMRIGAGVSGNAKLTLRSESDMDGGLYIVGFPAQLSNHLQIVPDGLNPCETNILADGTFQWNNGGTAAFQTFELFGGPTGSVVLLSAEASSTSLFINGSVRFSAISPAQITSNQDDYALGAGVFFRLSTDAQRNITGFTGGLNGRHIVIANVGSFNINIVNNSTSTAANRIITGIGTDLVIPPDQILNLIYDSTTTRWRAY